jgi:hypothetical protein
MRSFCLDVSFCSSAPPVVVVVVVVRAAPLAEKAGFDTLWFGEYYFYRDAPSVLGYVAAQTQSIKLGSGTINIFTRHPALVAMTAATLDELSGGRFVLGIRYGGFPVMPLMGYRMAPLHENKPLLRLRTVVEVVRRCSRLRPFPARTSTRWTASSADASPGVPASPSTSSPKGQRRSMPARASPMASSWPRASRTLRPSRTGSGGPVPPPSAAASLTSTWRRSPTRWSPGSAARRWTPSIATPISSTRSRRWCRRRLA